MYHFGFVTYTANSVKSYISNSPGRNKPGEYDGKSWERFAYKLKAKTLYSNVYFSDFLHIQNLTDGF